MKTYKTLDLIIKNKKNTIFFGEPNTQEELEEMFKLRYKIYSQKEYIDNEKYPDYREIDNYDKEKKCVYLIAKTKNKVIGAVRIIKDKKLPTEKYYQITDTEEILPSNPEQKCEIGRLIIDKYNPEEYTYLPKGIIMFFLTACVVDYMSKYNVTTAIAFIKNSLKEKMQKRKMPIHLINYNNFYIDEKDVLYKYFTQKNDPVIPIWLDLKETKKYLNKYLNNKILFKKINPDHYRLKDNLITNIIFKNSRSKLDSHFWKKYFTVYDILNKTIPYQILMDKIIESSDIKQDDIVLDVGSGTGNLSIKIEEKGAIVTGIDISPEGVDIHRSKNPKGEVFVGSITDPLPFPDNSFDKVVSNNVLYTIPRSKRGFVFREMYRVLKPGGIITLSNIKKGFKPINIYKDHIRKSIKSYGYLNTIKQIITFIIPTIKIFYYNSLIKKENKSGGYDFFEKNEQKKYLEKTGFINISEDISTYSDQAILNYARKPNL